MKPYQPSGAALLLATVTSAVPIKYAINDGGIFILVAILAFLSSLVVYSIAVSAYKEKSQRSAERTALAQASGETVFSVTMPLSRAANHAVALSFVPASEADEQVLLGYLPSSDTTDPADLPTELPGYLINMRAQFTLDGEVIAEGGSFALGTELEIAHRFTDPRRSIPVVRSIVVAGEYHAIGVDSGQINPIVLERTKAQLEQAKAELEAIQGQRNNNQTPTISDFLTKHTLTGNLLQTGILSYFAINDVLDQLDARSLNVVTHRMPSFGTFAVSLQPEYIYGVPRSVKIEGLSMDVDRIFTLAASKVDSREEAITFFRSTGPRKSAFEHLVPKQLFSKPERSADSISAVKALAIAASQGQKIYTITQANAAQINDLTISAAVKQEIVAAISAGKEVTVHQNSITYAGWTGEGYIVIDPETGAGAYKIHGGRDGAYVIIASALYGVMLYSILPTVSGVYAWALRWTKGDKIKAGAIAGYIGYELQDSIREGYRKSLTQIWTIRDSNCSDKIKAQYMQEVLLNEALSVLVASILKKANSASAADAVSVQEAKAFANFILYDIFPDKFWGGFEMDERVIDRLDECKS